MDVYQDDIITQEDPKPKPALAEEHRAKLDSIIQQMIKNKESDDNIHMVVNDFKQKYGQVQSEPTKPSARAPFEIKQPPLEFKPIMDWLTIPQDHKLQERGPVIPKEDFTKVPKEATIKESTAVKSGFPNQPMRSVGESTQKVITHLSDIDESVASVIRDQKHKNELNAMANADAPIQDATANVALKQYIRNTLPDKGIDVSNDEVQGFKNQMQENEPLARAALNKKVKILQQRDPEQAADLSYDLYNIDSKGRNSKEKLSNLEKIKNKEFIYDPENKIVKKPEGFWESLVSSRKDLNKLFDDYHDFTSSDKPTVINKLENDYKNYNPDKPIPMPDGYLGHIGAFLGGNPIKGIVAGAVAGGLTGAVTDNPAAAAAASKTAMAGVSAVDFYKMAKANGLRQYYNTFRSQGMKPEDAYNKADQLSEKQAKTDAVTAAAMGFIGGGESPNTIKLSTLFKKSIIKGLEDIGEHGAKKVLQGTMAGSVGAVGQIIKNQMAQQAGVHVKDFEGVGDQLLTGINMTVGASLAGKFPELLKPKTYNNIIHGLSKIPEETRNQEFEKLQQAEVLTPEQVQKVNSDIQKTKKIDSSIPETIGEADRLKVQDKIKERNLLQEQLEKADAAYHPDLKERIKSLNEEIVNISKGADKEGLQKLVHQEAQAGKIHGYTADVLQNATENELNGYMKDIAEQAHDPNSAAITEETFGKKIVNKAKELYPKEEPKQPIVSVIQPGEIQRPEVTTIAPSEAGAGKVPADQIGHVEVSEHGEDTKTAEGKENGVKPTKLSEAGRKEAEELGQYLIDNNKKKVITSEVARAQETANIAAEKANVPVETNPLLNTWDIGKYDGKPEGSFVEEAWVAKPNEAPEGGESFNDFTKRMEQAYQFVKSLPEDNHVVSHSKVMRALEALKNTDGKWTDETTKEFLTNKELPDAKDVRGNQGQLPEIGEIGKGIEINSGGNVQQVPTDTPTSGETQQQARRGIAEESKGTSKEKVGEPSRIGITHAQMDNIAREFGFDTYEKSPERVTEWDEQAAKRLQQPNALQDLFTKLRNGEIPDKVETRMMLQYMADLMAKIEKTPLDEALLQQLKRTKDLFNIAGREQGKALVARKGSIPAEETLGDFLIRDMEANKAPLTDKQKETAVNEYNDIKSANEKYQKELERVRAENNKLKAEKEVKKIAAKTKKQPKKDYSAERKEIVNDIREKLRKARGETSVVAVPYAKELIAIAPDVAKLVKNLVEEGIEKLPDIVKNIHGQLKELVPDIKEKDVHDIIAGEYNQKKSKTELSEKLYNLKLEAQLANKLEAKEAGIQPKNERQKIKRNQEIEALRQKIKDFDEEVAKAKREAKELAKQANRKTPEQIALDAIKTRTKNEISKIEEQLRTGDFTEPEKQPIKLDKEAQEAKEKLWKLKQEREVRLIKEKYKNQSAFDKGKDAVTNVLNAPRSIMSSMDYSAPLRQGLVASVAHPTLAARALRYMFKASVSQKQFDRWFMDLKDSPDYHEMVNSGLALADPHDPTATAHEEAFMSQLPEKIPGIGKLIKGSERAYTGFLNKMRVDSFRRLTDAFKTEGKTFENNPELYKAAADYVNATTGRGKLPEILEKSSPLLNALFFSPRLIASRLQLLTNPINPNFYRSIPKEVRVQYFKDMAKFVIAGTTILGLAKLAGADVEKDPRSTDFGKIKVGDTRWDIWGGFQQYVRFLTQVITGERKSASSGIVDELSGEGRFGKTRADVTTSFLRGKLAPVPATIWDILSGRTVVGEKLHYSFTEPTEGRDINLTDEAKKILLPLIYSDIKDAWQQQGWASIITTGVPSAFGVGVQTFTNDKGGSGGGAGATGQIKPTRTKPEKPHKIHR